MKVQILMTVSVDPDKWATEYGIAARNIPRAVRQDVKRWAINAVTQHPEGLIELA